VAIQFLPHEQAPVGAEALIADAIEPVCSPAFLASHQRQIEQRDLANLPIIQARYRRADWRDWADDQGLAAFPAHPAFEFPSSMLAYRATVLGLGLAIGQIPLLTRELDEGVLVRPFAAPIRRDMAYYLLLPRTPEPERKVRTFVAWLRDELARGEPNGV
jgi:LysR family glycine cleavage system transcriptional activator